MKRLSEEVNKRLRIGTAVGHLLYHPNIPLSPEDIQAIKKNLDELGFKTRIVTWEILNSPPETCGEWLIDLKEIAKKGSTYRKNLEPDTGYVIPVDFAEENPLRSYVEQGGICDGSIDSNAACDQFILENEPINAPRVNIFGAFIGYSEGGSSAGVKPEISQWMSNQRSFLLVLMRDKVDYRWYRHRGVRNRPAYLPSCQLFED